MENMADLEPLGDDADNRSGKENLPAIVGEMLVVPAFIADGGERAGYAFIDFFTAQIRNRNTRAAYAIAVRSFCAWSDAKGLTLGTLRTHHVAAYVVDAALSRNEYRHTVPTYWMRRRMSVI